MWVLLLTLTAIADEPLPEPEAGTPVSGDYASGGFGGPGARPGATMNREPRCSCRARRSTCPSYRFASRGDTVTGPIRGASGELAFKFASF